MEANNEEVVANSPEQRNLSTFFSIRDVVSILIGAIAIASAFFMYDTRITVLERDLVQTKAVITETRKNEKQLTDLNASMSRILAVLQNDEARLEEDVKEIMKRLRSIEIRLGNKKGG